MEKKVKVFLLGYKESVLSPIVEKINSTRPVDVRYFLDMKLFLAETIKNKPDLVGVSVNYPHKSVPKFPRVFSMALNLKVLLYAEAQSLKASKLLSSLQADYKITGEINAHNLWIKILNFINAEEEIEDPTSSSKNSSQKDSNKDKVVLQSSKDKETDSAKSNLISSLYDALTENDPNKDKEDSDSETLSGSSSSDEANDSEDNPLRGKRKPIINHVSNGPTIEGEDDDYNGSLYNSSKQKDKPRNFQQIKGGKTPKEKGSFQEGDPNVSLRNGDQEEGGDLLQNINGKKAGQVQNPEKNLKPVGEPETREDSGEQGFAKSALDKNKDKNGGLKTQEKSNKGSADTLEESNTFQKKKSLKEMDADILEQAEELFEQLTKDDGGSEGFEEVAEDDWGEAETASEEEDYGSVQVADADEIAKEKEEKKKRNLDQEQSKKQDVLKEACRLAAASVFESKEEEQPISFNPGTNICFTLESGNYKGYLLLSYTKQEEVSFDHITDFRIKVVNHLKDNGISARVSEAFFLEANITNYNYLIREFSDFSLDWQGLDEAQQNICFIPREALVPLVEESDKEDMYWVSVKHIPPKTPVNFDLFIYLPRNQRFVRYLAEGRSLSLKQAKRHTEESDGQEKMYLPKNYKNKFFQFYIQNTLNWEYAVHGAKKVQAS